MSSLKKMTKNKFKEFLKKINKKKFKYNKRLNNHTSKTLFFSANQMTTLQF